MVSFSMPGKFSLRNPVPLRSCVAAAFLAGMGGFWAAQMAGAEGLTAPRLTPLVSSGRTISGETIVYPSGTPARITAIELMLAPGAETGWHTHGAPAFGYILDGELTVEYAGQGSRVYRSGEAVLEAIAVPHNGRNTGSGPMRILAVFVGADGVSNSSPSQFPQ